MSDEMYGEICALFEAQLSTTLKVQDERKSHLHIHITRPHL